ncbi:MAG: ribosome small subunit-dependent GTPase A [Lachnospiraceae bacterium]|nr:ribosome small subunit-dependent GTPase A [Lachnospiraceae bacterium]
MDLKKYGFMPNMMPENAQGIPARITAVHKERYELICEYGETYGRLKKTEYFGGFEEFPTTGDFVLINYIPNGDSQITRTLPRKTFFSRRDPSPGRGEQAVASNFDYVFIIQSLNHDFNAKRLERYLALAWQSGGIPVVVLTKADLVDESVPYIRIVESCAMGVPVYAVSSKTGSGLNALSAYMSPGKTIIFLGSSGVGKSSLVNALADEDIMAVNGIREDDSKGRHTTTHRQLIMLKNSAMIIDTPGMRELGMWDVSTGLGEAFADVEHYLGKCKFSDCKHQTEPGCAIKAAIANGELSRERWKRYFRLKAEAKHSDDKAAFLRQKQERKKNIAKYNRQKKTGKKWGNSNFGMIDISRDV